HHQQPIVKILEPVLKKEGFQHIYKPYHPDQPLHILKNHTPNLLLLHIKIPPMHRSQILKRIKLIHQHIRVIIMTPY
uniref:response regulator n=1 Tax=Bacillus altitudinis TaxID=293387 RepID=UPI0011A6887D